MPVLQKAALEAEVAAACALLDHLLPKEGAEAEPDRPAAAVNSFFLEQAKGLVFHWSLSAGAGVGFKAGRGFAIAKVDGRWSCPCFVTTGGVAVGAIAGVEKVDTLLVAETERPIVNLSHGQQSVVGQDLTSAVIPGVLKAKSRLDLSEAATKGTDLYCVSYAKGLAVNFSISGGRLVVDDERNRAMFGAGTTGRTTLGGLDPMPAELEPLVAKINQVIAAGKAA